MSAFLTKAILLLNREAFNLPLATSLYTYWRVHPISTAAFQILLALQIHDWLYAVGQVLLSFLSDTLCLRLTFLGAVLLHTAP